MVLIEQNLGFKAHQRRRVFLNAFNWDPRITAITLIGQKLCSCKEKIKFCLGFHTFKFSYSLMTYTEGWKFELLRPSHSQLRSNKETPPFCFSSHTVSKYHFVIHLVSFFFSFALFVISSFKMTPKHSTKMLSSV